MQKSTTLLQTNKNTQKQIYVEQSIYVNWRTNNI